MIIGQHSFNMNSDCCWVMKGRRNVQVNREDFNLLLLIVVFVVFQDHFLSITATMMDFCWKHSAPLLHIFFLQSPSQIFSPASVERFWRHFHPACKNLFFSSFPACQWKNSGVWNRAGGLRAGTTTVKYKVSLLHCKQPQTVFTKNKIYQNLLEV